jgi:outer membrane protein assembly factor BamB
MPLTLSKPVGFGACTLALFFSCTKPTTIGGITIPRLPQHLSPFSVQVVFRQPDKACIKWSPSDDLLGDTIYYDVVLQDHLLDSNLLTVTDTLTGLTAATTYKGRVIAHTRYNDTISAPFTLYMLQGYAFSRSPDNLIKCVDIFSDQVVWQSNINIDSYDFSGMPLVMHDTVFVNYRKKQTFAFNAMTGAMLWQSEPYLQDIANAPLGNISATGGGPVYYNGNIYATSGPGVVCLNSSNGKIIWKYTNGDGFQTTPVVDNNKIFVGSGNDYGYLPKSYYTALDAASGDTLWTRPFGAYTTECPIVCNGLLVFVDDKSQVYAVDENTGNTVWKKDLSVSYNNLPTMSPLMHYNNIIIGYENGKIYGLSSATGNIVWQLPAKGYPYFEAGISHDTLFVAQTVGDYNHENEQLMAVRVTSGTVLWQKIDSSNSSSLYFPIIAAGKIYLPGSVPDEGLAIYDATNGNLLWQTRHSNLGAIEVDGAIHYNVASGMVQ